MAKKKKNRAGWANYRGQNDSVAPAPSCVGGAGSMIYHTRPFEGRGAWVEVGLFDRYAAMAKPKSKGYKRAAELLRKRQESHLS